jgi:hypothetical protein
LITISRLLARRLRSIFRQALSLTPSLFAQPIQLTAGPEGLQVAGALHGFAACYQQPGALAECNLTIPYSLLKEVEGNHEEPVYLIPKTKGSVLARWQDGAVPQERTVEVPADKSDVVLPARPVQWVENPPDLRLALAETARVVDPSAARYALGCIQLRGAAGDVNATDGHEVYRHGGFQFGTERELLVRPCGVFAAKEFSVEQPVQFGTTDQHVVLGVGGWQFWLPLEKEGRFPRIDDVIPGESNAATTLVLSRSDREFLADNLSRLPGDADTDRPVTMDLNGCVAIRGRSGDQGSVTELRLSNSVRSGNEIRVNTNRRFLERAAQLGFERLAFVAPESPIVCRDGRRTYVWAVLNAKDAIPAGKSVVIESPAVRRQKLRQSNIQTIPRSPTTTMATRQSVTSPESATPSAHAAPSQKEPSVTDQAITLRASLRNTLDQVNNLLRAIKRQKRQEKFLRSTLASLKELQQVA